MILWLVASVDRERVNAESNCNFRVSKIRLLLALNVKVLTVQRGPRQLGIVGRHIETRPEKFQYISDRRGTQEQLSLFAMNQERFDQFMKFFPSQAEILRMEPHELGPFVLRYMTVEHAMTNRFNFAQSIPAGEISNRFMEAWSWLEREGFIAHRAQDKFGIDYFVTRTGQKVSTDEEFEAFRKASIFPFDLDDEIMRVVKPLFLRGDYDTAVFRAFKEVEVRVRKKAGLTTEYGRALMLKAFGETGPLMVGNKEDRSAARELFAGAISLFKNPSSHHEIQFENPREVVDMICVANQLLRIVDRLPSP